MSDYSKRKELMAEMKKLRKQPRTKSTINELIRIEDELKKLEFGDKNIDRFNKG